MAHKEIVTAVRHRYFKGLAADDEMTLHKMLAGYWYRLADPGRDGSWRSNYTRAFSELSYHLVSSLKDAFLSRMFPGNLICNVYELKPVIAFIVTIYIMF